MLPFAPVYGTEKRQEFLLKMVVLTGNTCFKQLISILEMQV